MRAPDEDLRHRVAPAGPRCHLRTERRHRLGVLGAGGQVDPFVRISPPSSQPGQDPKIYLLDTQPVMREAAYAYVVVRFEPNGEIRDVVPVPAVTIP